MDELNASWERYRSLLDCPQAFRQSLAQPQPVCFWCNPLKTSAEQLLNALPDTVVPQPVSWMPGAFRVAHWPHPGLTLAHQAGWYYLQEEIAMAAVAALAPQPGERVLDLCAAPGGKTVQIALKVGPMGLVVANDFHAQRQPQLRLNLSRLGVMNGLVTQVDARSWLLPPHQFDRVLVDVPCSGEGQVRRRRGAAWRAAFSRRIQRVQAQLLRQALRLVKPGGTVVYSTCTFAPEENEAIIQRVLGRGDCIEPVAIPGLRAAAGLLEWQGDRFRSDMRHAHRYWPHLNNTGGFFLARIRRSESALEVGTKTSQPAATPVRSHPVLDWLWEHYDVSPQAWADHWLWDRGGRKLWLSSFGQLPAGVEPQGMGLPVVQRQAQGLKPTTALLQRLGCQVRRHWVELPTAAAAVAFLQGHDQPYSSPKSSGFVQVRYGPYVLGCGLLGGGRLRSQIPKSWRWPR